MSPRERRGGLKGSTKPRRTLAGNRTRCLRPSGKASATGSSNCLGARAARYGLILARSSQRPHLKTTPQTLERSPTGPERWLAAAYENEPRIQVPRRFPALPSDPSGSSGDPTSAQTARPVASTRRFGQPRSAPNPAAHHGEWICARSSTPEGARTVVRPGFREDGGGSRPTARTSEHTARYGRAGTAKRGSVSRPVLCSYPLVPISQGSRKARSGVVARARRWRRIHSRA